MHQQVVPRLAPSEPLGVVQPGVAVLLVPAADQQQLARGDGRGAVERLRDAVEVGDEQFGRQVDPLVVGLQPLGHRRAQRAEVDAFGVLAQRAHRRPAAGLEQPGDDGRRAGREPGLGRQPVLEPGAEASLEPLGELAEDLPVVPCVVGLGEHRGREPRRVAHREAVEDQVVVVALQRRGRRQDHVGVPGGLVEVDVDGDHEVQPVEGAGQGAAVGRRQHRVAGDRHHRPDLAVAGSLDLLAHRGGRQLAGELRDLPHPAAPDVVVAGPDDPPAHGVDGRLGEQHAALAVEVPGEQVQQVDRPLAHRAEALRGQPHPAVRRGRRPPPRTPG